MIVDDDLLLQEAEGACQQVINDLARKAVRHNCLVALEKLVVLFDYEDGYYIEHMNTPAGEAVVHENTAALECIARVCPASLDVKGDGDRLPIHDAAIRGNLDALHIIVAASAVGKQNLCATTYDGLTPAIFAALYNRRPFLQYVLDHSPRGALAELQQKTDYDQTMLQMVDRKNKPFIRALLRHYQRRMPEK